MDTHGFIEIVQNKNLHKSAKILHKKLKTKKFKKENRQWVKGGRYVAVNYSWCVELQWHLFMGTSLPPGVSRGSSAFTKSHVCQEVIHVLAVWSCEGSRSCRVEEGQQQHIGEQEEEESAASSSSTI